MRTIQQSCLDQIEAINVEKQEDIDRFTKEKERMKAEAIALRNSFAKQREEMESENDREKKRIIDQYEKER